VRCKDGGFVFYGRDGHEWLRVQNSDAEAPALTKGASLEIDRAVSQMGAAMPAAPERIFGFVNEHEEDVDAEEVLRIAKAVAQRYANRCWWADVGDMVQEATVAIIVARRTWDPQVGVPFDGYAARAAALRVKDWLWRESSPVTGGLHDPRKNVAGVHAAELKDDVAPQPARDPGEALDEIDWRLRVRRRLRALAGRTRDGDLAAEVLVRGRPPADVIRETGADVYGAVHLVRRKVGSDARMYALWRRKR